MSLKLGEILYKAGLINQDQLLKVLEEQKRNNTRFVTALLQLGFVNEEKLVQVLSQNFKLSPINLGRFAIQQEALKLLTREFCEKHVLIPIQIIGDSGLLIACAEPLPLPLIDQIRFLTKRKPQFVFALETYILQALDRVYGMSVQSSSILKIEQDEDENNEDIVIDVGGEKDGADGSVISFVNSLLTDAIRKKVSDIHIEPYEKRLRIRFRIDGNLVEVQNQPINVAPPLISRIKIMAKLDITEKRRPQDGRIKITYKKGKDMDFRVSVMPTIHGEKVVLRLLDKSNLQLDMTKLGFESDDLELFRKCIHMPQGMVLITGPTGSGKTTTIYSALAELNQPDVNISTAEDPVEFNLDGINQLQVNHEIGVTFASALRTFLRQDPDIIMVGEIRDLETAEIAAKAASTGHLVVSTLHTNDAPQTVTRLIEMGVPPYVITSTVILIVAQRLVGKICESCKQPYKVPPQVLLDLGVPEAEISEYQIFNAKGCQVCNQTGVKGRLAIYELMNMTENLKEAILKGASSSEIRKIAKAEGMRTLRRAALLKLKRGQTTIQEVLNSSVRDT